MAAAPSAECLPISSGFSENVLKMWGQVKHILFLCVASKLKPYMSGCGSQLLCEAWIQAIKRHIKPDKVTGMRGETGVEAESGK